jgi:hypothetical protein
LQQEEMMRLPVVSLLLSLSSMGTALACPLDDMFKLCIASGGSLSALHQGVKQGNWTLQPGAVYASSLSAPSTGNELYTMPSGLQFFVNYQNYTNLFSSTCSLNFTGATMKRGVEDLHCSAPQLAAFEKALEEAPLGKITKEDKATGTTYLIEGEHRWLTAFVSTEDISQGQVNGWVETSVAQPNKSMAFGPDIH